MLLRWMFGVVMLGSVACGDDATGGAGGVGGGTGGEPAMGGGDAGLQARHERYCEVLIGYLEGDQVRIDVWNTWTLNDCPQDLWAAMDSTQIAEENGALLAVLNGPRYWALDEFVDSAPADLTTKVIGGLEFFKPAELYRSPSELMQQPEVYTSMTVDRDTTFRYVAGAMVHELIDPEGGVWVLQTYDGVDGAKTDAALAELGSTLVIPDGWEVRSRTLSEDLFVEAEGTAYILRDDAGSTYQLSQQ
jgi:hypothetical protein